MVGLEPSCTALFRHEAVDLLPGDERAVLAKAQVRTLAETVREYQRCIRQAQAPA